ncbi:MAG: hypothetical protein PF541_09145 [Prolixibacteraceae bacterium]|jgi:hypothetical protein|nr:hypothetical protein [Prolixibacteraceae bacterium]
MIRSLIIGTEQKIDLYLRLISQLNYFGETQKMVLKNNEKPPSDYFYELFDAIFIVSSIPNPFQFFEDRIKSQCKLYLVDQPTLSIAELNELDKLNAESGNLLYIEVVELQHPLVQDFISTNGSHLMFRYNKSINNRKSIRTTLLNAICFLSILSPMQVKKIDINSIETTQDERPVLKIRLKLFDSSIAYIIIKFESKNEHSILIETKDGSFTFNFTEKYLENIYGKKFRCDLITDDELILKSLESFALHIILNNNPTFSFHHYCLAIIPLMKIENILQNSF